MPRLSLTQSVSFGFLALIANQQKSAVGFHRDIYFFVVGEVEHLLTERDVAIVAISDQCGSTVDPKAAEIHRKRFLGGLTVDSGDVPAATRLPCQHHVLARITGYELRIVPHRGNAANEVSHIV